MADPQTPPAKQTEQRPAQQQAKEAVPIKASADDPRRTAEPRLLKYSDNQPAVTYSKPRDKE
jgi:hypothetical protein